MKIKRISKKSINLESLYSVNYQKFIDYNIQDVDILAKIDKKTSILNTSIALCKLYNCNLDSVIGTVTPWNQKIYCECYKNKYGTPEFYGDIEEVESITNDSSFNLTSNSEYDNYPDFLGGTVGANPGFYKWVVSFDFASLYPSILRACNYAYDSHIPYSKAPKEIQDIVKKYYYDNKAIPSTINRLINNTAEIEKEVTPILKKYKMHISPTGDIFDTSYITFISKLVDDIYNARKTDKKKMKMYSKKAQLYKDYIHDIKNNKKCKFINEIDEENRNKSIEELEKIIEDYNKLVVYYNAGQMSKKLALNSFYGAGGNKYFILYKLEIARSITAIGRLLDLYWMDKLQKRLSKKNIIALWDTDSGYIVLEDVIDKLHNQKKLNKNDYVNTAKYIADKLEPKISEFNKKNIDYIGNIYNFKRPEVIELEREIIASSGIVNGMRNYAMNVIDSEGTIYHEGYIKMAGLNLKKTNIPPVIRKELKKGLQIILTKTQNDFSKYYTDIKKYYYSLDYNEIAFPKNVTFEKQSEKRIKEAKQNYIKYKNKRSVLFEEKQKTIDDFLNYSLTDKGVPIHVRASLIYNKIIEKNKLETKYRYIENKTKMKYLYINKSGLSFNSNVIGYLDEKSCIPFIKEFGFDKIIDKKTMFNKTIFASLDKLVENRGWKFPNKVKKSLI